MSFFKVCKTAAATAMVFAAAPHVAAAAPLLVEGKPQATRVVTVSRAELSDPTATSAVRVRLSQAAKAVCRDEYPGEDIYLFSRACFTGSFGDAMERWGRLRAQIATDQRNFDRVAIVVTAR